MTKILYLALGLFSLCLSSISNAQLNQESIEWKLRRDRNGVAVYTGKMNDSPYKAISTSMVLNAKPESIAALIMDLKNCSRWAPLCKEAKEHRRVSATESYVYSLNNLPFPLRDRDFLAHVRWSRNAASGIIKMESRAKQGVLNETKGVVRVRRATSQWAITPLADGKVLVESFAHVDPNGPIPAWIVNQLIVGTPYKTMKNLRKLIERGEYSNAQLAF